VNSFSLELEFKPELPILSDQALNFAFTKVNNGVRANTQKTAKYVKINEIYRYKSTIHKQAGG